jgi:small subunit ribosomal protein S20
MASHKSAEKRTRQSERRRVVNRQNRGRLRTGIKALRAAVDSGKPEEVQALLPSTVSLIDKSIQKGVIHKNTAARHKKRLTRRANAIAKA